MSGDPYRVPGEDLAWFVPFAALGGGGACSAAAAMLIAAASAPPAVMPRDAPVPAVVAPVAADSARPAAAAATVAAATVAAPPPPARAPGECAPLAIDFRYAADTVPTTALPALKRIATWMQAHPNTTALVHGHADALGNEDKNLALSKQRARNVSLVLAMDGVSKGRLTVRGFGTYQPVEGLPEGASANRRVVVVIKAAAECPPVEEVAAP